VSGWSNWAHNPTRPSEIELHRVSPSAATRKEAEHMARNRCRAIGATFVAALALGAVASASASAALPEFALSSGEKFPVTIEGSTSSGYSGIEARNGSLWGACVGAKTKGEITGAKAISLTLELASCGETSHHYHTKGAPVGTIVVSGTGTLVYISKATKAVGVLFTPKETKVYEDGGSETGASFEFWGNIVVPVTPIDTKTSKFELPFRKGKGAGEQEFTKYENEKGEVKSATLIQYIGGYEGVADLYIDNNYSLTASKSLTIEG
jgi:hypothetical protein